MKVLNKADDHVSENNRKHFTDENDNISFIPKLSLLSVPSGVLLLFLLGLRIWSTLKPLFS